MSSSTGREILHSVTLSSFPQAVKLVVALSRCPAGESGFKRHALRFHSDCSRFSAFRVRLIASVSCRTSGITEAGRNLGFTVIMIRLCFARKQRTNWGETERNALGTPFAKDISLNPSICYARPARRMDSCECVRRWNLAASNRLEPHRILRDGRVALSVYQASGSNGTESPP